MSRKSSHEHGSEGHCLDFDTLHGVALFEPDGPLHLYANRHAVGAAYDRFYVLSSIILLLAWLTSVIACQILGILVAGLYGASTICGALLIGILWDYRQTRNGLRSAPAVLEIMPDSITWRSYTGQHIVTFPWTLVKTIESSSKEWATILTFEFEDPELLSSYAANREQREFLRKNLRLGNGRIHIPTLGLPVNNFELEQLLKLRLISRVKDA